MSQNTTQVPTGSPLSGLSMINDINAALDTIQTNSSGNSDPGTIGAYKFWADTTNGYLKIRNAANNGWVTIGKLGDMGIQSGAQSMSAAGGTADAITASYSPAIMALPATGLPLWVRAGAANATATPTFTPNAGTITPYVIVKGSNQALVANDIAGAGHWLALNWDNTLSKWVLLNPTTGVNPLVAGASTSVAGVLQLATSAQATALASSTLALVPSTLAAVLNINTSGANAPVYSCRAWACLSTVQSTGTYSQSGTTVTVNITNHTCAVGQYVYVTPGSGTGVAGWYPVATVADANHYTYTAGTSLTTSGSITQNIVMRAGGNISGIVYNSAGDFTVTFATSMDDAYYSVSGSACNTNTTNAHNLVVALKSSSGSPTVKTANQCRLITVAPNNDTAYDSTDVSIKFFR